jgi:hypothetical protein
MRPYLKKTLHKNRTGGVTQGEGPEFKPQYCKKKKKIHLVELHSNEIQKQAGLSTVV